MTLSEGVRDDVCRNAAGAGNSRTSEDADSVQSQHLMLMLLGIDVWQLQLRPLLMLHAEAALNTLQAAVTLQMIAAALRRVHQPEQMIHYCSPS
jgi:hypothetical protein